jgi:uncharacterized peroxidase-related enzyme
MAYIHQIEPAEATDDLAAFYDGLVERIGSVPSIVKLASLTLPAVKAAQDLYQSVLYNDSALTMVQKEMVATLVSSINGCGYCVEHHGAALDDAAGQPGLADRVVQHRWQDLDPLTTVLLAFGEKLTRAPAAMSARDVEALRSHGLMDKDVLDLVQVISYFNYTNRLATALGVDPEPVR